MKGLELLASLSPDRNDEPETVDEKALDKDDTALEAVMAEFRGASDDKAALASLRALMRALNRE